MSLREFDDYVGIPFEDHGRSRNGLDCWGLVQLIYREKLGIEIPGFDDRYASVKDKQTLKALIEGNMSDWKKVPIEEVMAYDCMLMKGLLTDYHIGVVLSRGMLIHVEGSHNGAVIENYNSLRLKNRLLGVYRHV